MTAAKRITSKDVAQRAGVSRTTVSFVLNNVDGVQISPETRQRVLQAAAELNYIPDASAQSLASGRAHALGLVMSRHPRQIASDAFLSQMLDNLVREANRYGMRILVEPEGSQWWVMNVVPVVMTILGAIVVVLVIRRMLRPIPASSQ